MKVPGKAYRKGLTLLHVIAMFNEEQKAKEWLAEQRWKGRPQCPHCGRPMFKAGSSIRARRIGDCESITNRN